jgi:hypothetical protein
MRHEVAVELLRSKLQESLDETRALKVAVELTCSCATRSFSAAARASFSAVSQRVRCDSST